MDNSTGTGRRLLTWGALALGLALIVTFAMPSYRQGEASIAGKTANNFGLDLSGKPIQLADLRGKVVVLNFWASWCPPCIEEAPSLNRLHQYIASRNALATALTRRKVCPYGHRSRGVRSVAS